MIKASNIIEIAQQFDPSQVLTTEDKDFHQNIYDTTINPLKTKLLLNQIPTKTYFLCGQIGMGKSTALNYLPDDKINAKYEVKYLTGKELFNIEDIDIIDILLMIGFELIKNTKLEEVYYEGLNKLKDINLENIKIGLEESWEYNQEDEKKQTNGINLNVHISKFESSIFKNLKKNTQQRQTIREIFNIDKANLIEFINDIISDYKEMINNDKELLLIIDDLEKINNKDIIHSVFVENNWIFNEINCVKIIPIHIFFPRMSASKDDLIELAFRIDNNKLDKTDDSKIVEANIKSLRELIESRLENKKLINNDAYIEVIRLSGGNIRQIIEIIHQASINNITKDSERKGTIIDTDDILWGADQISARLSKIADSKIRVLNQISNNFKQFEEPTQKDEDDFDIVLLNNLVFFHKNGTHWYDVNPIIAKTVEIHGNQQTN
ncbi:MAG: hypothetical protein DRG78_09975 [Epsilonproteobacteria bacterium]|nr:MAG: hypothetical protein DRG78_09975 [Campylobacterota bacterium]